MKLVPLSKFIEQQNETIIIDDDKEYTRVTAKLHRKGIVFRDKIDGFEIKTKTQQICKAEQLLVAEIDAKVGGYGIVPKNLEGAIVSSHYFLFNINKNALLPKYLEYVLKTDEFFSQINAQGSTNYASIRPKHILSIKIPYCSVDSQKSIVEKLDNITTKHSDLKKTILKGNNYCSKLKQTILQEAVSGKLVKQDKNDEPASELLVKIKAEKEKMLKEKKIKRIEKTLAVSNEEKPFEIPHGWEWIRLHQICTKITDGTHYTPTYVSDGVPFLSVKNISKGEIDMSECKYITPEEHSVLFKRCNPEHLDILLTKVGTTGIAKIVDVRTEFSIFVSVALLKIPKKYIYPYFLENLLNSPLVKKQSEKGTRGVGNKNLVLKSIKNFIVPLPPFKEQIRIVKRINNLMKLWGDLQKNTEVLQKNSELFMEIMLKEVFGS